MCYRYSRMENTMRKSIVSIYVVIATTLSGITIAQAGMPNVQCHYSNPTPESKQKIFALQIEQIHHRKHGQPLVCPKLTTDKKGIQHVS